MVLSSRRTAKRESLLSRGWVRRVGKVWLADANLNAMISVTSTADASLRSDIANKIRTTHRVLPSTSFLPVSAPQAHRSWYCGRIEVFLVFSEKWMTTGFCRTRTQRFSKKKCWTDWDCGTSRQRLGLKWQLIDFLYDRHVIGIAMFSILCITVLLCCCFRFRIPRWVEGTMTHRSMLMLFALN